MAAAFRIKLFNYQFFRSKLSQRIGAGQLQVFYTHNLPQSVAVVKESGKTPSEVVSRKPSSAEVAKDAVQLNKEILDLILLI
jgi:hypothetical protein